MILNELTKDALDAAAPALGGGPVIMLNQIWFRSEVAYPTAVPNAQPEPRAALYKGYAAAFVEIA